MGITVKEKEKIFKPADRIFWYYMNIPVKIKIAAPINIAIMEVSPTEPGIVP